MKSPDDKPSLWDVRACLLSSLDHAEDFARTYPLHAAAVTRFAQELRRLKSELMDEEGSGPSTLHDIVNGLTGARAMASILSEYHPDKSGALTRFKEGLIHTQEEFLVKVSTTRP
jgi:hypothetical protein